MFKKLTEAQGVIIAALIGGIFLCIVAILDNPIVEKWAESQFNTPTVSGVTPTIEGNNSQPSEEIFSSPTSQPTVDIDEVLSNIVPGNGGIKKAAPWWKAIAVARENGIYDPTAFPGAEGCFGVAWNVMELDHTVVVFQSAQTLDFQAGGHYSLICLTNNVELSATDVGRVQSTWLSKEHGGTWRVQVLD